MGLKKSLKKIIKSILQNVNWINRDWEDKSLILQAKILMSSDYWREGGQNLQINSKEYRVYSQWGDDGIIQYLVHKLNIENKKFIEFGVGNYFESNTHFLLVNNNWSGYVIDGSQKCMDIVKDSPFFWRYDLKLKTAFINKENINNLLSESNFSNIGLLHIDLDGNDYWILNVIDMKKYSPDILILEYNSNFGAERQITIPYNPLFSCIDGHHSGQYFGASLAALNTIAMDKGYYFIGCNLAGNNAYFIKNKYQSVIKPVSLIKGFTSAKSRDERDSEGNLLFSSRESSIEAIRGLPVFNILTNQVEDF
jgi:hypothetical protein